MIDGRFRDVVNSYTEPVGRGLVRLGASADVLTTSGLLFACVTGWAIGSGHHVWAIFFLTLTGAHDLFDGPVAKASNTASQRGSFFDSVIDRLSDGVLMAGVMFYLETHHHGLLVLLPFAIATSTFMISYERSKAESLGLHAKGGLMERAERMILLGVSLVANVLFLPVLWLLLALTTMTALGRFYRVWRIAEGPKRATRESRSMGGSVRPRRR